MADVFAAAMAELSVLFTLVFVVLPTIVITLLNKAPMALGYGAFLIQVVNTVYWDWFDVPVAVLVVANIVAWIGVIGCIVMGMFPKTKRGQLPWMVWAFILSIVLKQFLLICWVVPTWFRVGILFTLAGIAIAMGITYWRRKKASPAPSGAH